MDNGAKSVRSCVDDYLIKIVDTRNGSVESLVMGVAGPTNLYPVPTTY